MQKDILIFGAGGFARGVLWTIEDINQDGGKWNIIGVLDDDPTKWGREINGYPIYCPHSFLAKLKGNCYFVCGIASSYVKQQVAGRFRQFPLQYANLIHPSVVMNRTVRLDGAGITIQAGTTIAPNVVLKSHVTVNMNVTLGHDASILEYSTLAPGALISGYVTVGPGTDIGTGAAVIQGLTVGKECVVGANAAVIRDIPDYSVAVGVPAKVIKTIEPRMAGNLAEKQVYDLTDKIS